MTNSIHDMGGMMGFGKIEPEPDEPLFHAGWEGRVLAMTRAMGYAGLWTLDAFRAAQENLAPQTYLASSYYERWCRGLERLVVAHGLAGEDELAAGRPLRPGIGLSRKLPADAVPNRFLANFARPNSAPTQFKPGDAVRARNINPTTHTRLPRYARGKTGIVEAVRGCHVFPDAAALGAGDNPQWLYTVVFTARELWGEGADPAIKVSIEAFEPYLGLP
jgi:nitrile hydratase subunit beta